MTQPAIPTDTTPDGDEQHAWYPFPELAGPLESLHGQCVALDEQATRIIREAKATLDALIAETDRGLAKIRDARKIVRDLNAEQSAQVLHDLHEEAMALYQSAAKES